MEIAYLTQMNVQGSRGHVHNTLKTCEALQQAGASVSLVNVDRTPPDMQEIFERHHIATPFDCLFLGTVPVERQFHSSKFVRILAFVRMNLSFMRFLWRRRRDFDLVYYRNHLLLGPALLWRIIINKPLFFESHYVYIFKFLPQFVTTLSVKTANGIIAITRALKEYYRLSDDRCIVAPCHAVEADLIPIESTEALRRELRLPQEKMILCYTGSLGATIQGISYEVEAMIDILPSLPDQYVSIIVGEREGSTDGDELRTRAARLGVQDRVVIRPWCDRPTLMKYLSAADILMMPRVGTAPGSSPSKMFDYLPVKKPIIAASTPAVDEILTHEKNALLVNADHPEEWAQAIERLERDPHLRERLVEGTIIDAETYTWPERGRRIRDFIERRTAHLI